MKSKILIVLAAALSGCGQPYDPSPEAQVPDLHGGGGVFDPHDDETVYQSISYEGLRSALVDVLGTTEAGPLAAGCDAVTACPKSHPVSFLDANRTLLGAPIYETNAENSSAPGPIEAPGFRAWILASSSACGKMVERGDAARLFPQGQDDYAFAYAILIGRAVHPDEIAELDALRAAQYAGGARVFPTYEGQAAAVCTAILTSIEFLGSN